MAKIESALMAFWPVCCWYWFSDNVFGFRFSIEKMKHSRFNHLNKASAVSILTSQFIILTPHHLKSKKQKYPK